MKKKLLIFTIIAIIIASCDKKEVYQEKQIDFGNIAPFSFYEVPVTKGKVTIVTYGDDTLAITGIPMTIEVPKEALKDRTKAGSLTVQYSSDPKFEGYKDRGTIRSDCVLMFEDTRSGDDDYNDLIIWVKKDETRTWWPDNTVSCQFTITPIALGAMKDFKLGVENELGTEFILVENCRDGLFDGKRGFINTEANVAPEIFGAKKGFGTGSWKYNPSNGNTTLNWFIETSDERMYIAETDKSVNQSNLQKYGNDKGRPYGIAFPTTANDIFRYGGPFYATECTPIQKVYGNFDDWISGKWTEPLSSGGGKGVRNTDPAICYNISNPR